MKNIKPLLLSTSAAALIAMTQAAYAAPVHYYYEIDYSYKSAGKYTSSKPLDSSLVPDPTNALNPGNHGSTLTDLAPIAVSGKGIIHKIVDTTAGTATGTINLLPINFEVRVTSGSYGYVGWSQTFKGTFQGINGAIKGDYFTMADTTVVNGGSLVCEIINSSSCTGSGGVGSAPTALKPPQTYPDPSEDEFGEPIPGGPLTLLPTISFSSQGAAQYLFQDDVSPAYTDTTIDVVVGQVLYLPVPAAAWLFAPSLMALVAGKRLNRKKSA